MSSASDLPPGSGEGSQGRFANAWDRYVDDARRVGQVWPGDDWGDPVLWNAWFLRLLGDFGAATWQRVVEIGQGTGKYTSRVLAAGNAQLLACDVSERFLGLCRERLAEHVASGRLRTRLVDERDPFGIPNAVAAEGWTGAVDAVFSIDTFVHLTFTQVAAILLGTTSCLRPGGVMAFTYACGTSEPGRRKMIQDLDRVIRAGSEPTTGCFHWVSPELVRVTAEAMGYEVAICDVDPLHGRDGHFVGRLRDLDRARGMRELQRG